MYGVLTVNLTLPRTSGPIFNSSILTRVDDTLLCDWAHLVALCSGCRGREWRPLRIIAVTKHNRNGAGISSRLYSQINPIHPSQKVEITVNHRLRGSPARSGYFDHQFDYYLCEWGCCSKQEDPPLHTTQ